MLVAMGRDRQKMSDSSGIDATRALINNGCLERRCWGGHLPKGRLTGQGKHHGAQTNEAWRRIARAPQDATAFAHTPRAVTDCLALFLLHQHTSVGEDDTMAYAISEMQGWRISECGGVVAQRNVYGRLISVLQHS